MSVSRVLSLIVLGFYLIVLFFMCQGKSSEENFRTAVPFLIFNGFCLACIWFPDEMGNFVIYRVTSTSPGCIVAIMGWIVYVSFLIVLSLN